MPTPSFYPNAHQVLTQIPPKFLRKKYFENTHPKLRSNAFQREKGSIETKTANALQKSIDYDLYTQQYFIFVLDWSMLNLSPTYKSKMNTQAQISVTIQTNKNEGIGKMDRGN